MCLRTKLCLLQNGLALVDVFPCACCTVSGKPSNGSKRDKGRKWEGETEIQRRLSMHLEKMKRKLKNPSENRRPKEKKIKQIII